VLIVLGSPWYPLSPMALLPVLGSCSLVLLGIQKCHAWMQALVPLSTLACSHIRIYQVHIIATCLCL
jgi:hypothetical protein